MPEPNDRPDHRISKMTEKQMINEILLIYTDDKEACLQISKHIAEKLMHRRILIRDERKAEVQRGKS